MTNFILLTEEANKYIFSDTNATILFLLGFGNGLYVVWYQDIQTLFILVVMKAHSGFWLNKAYSINGYTK